MPVNDLGDVRYSIDHDKRILFAERHDKLDKRGVYAEWHAMQELDGFDPAYDTLVDYSSVSEVELDYEALKELNQAMPSRDPRTGNVAIVTGTRLSRVLLGRFFCMLSNMITKRKHQVFNDREQAEAWLMLLRND